MKRENVKFNWPLIGNQSITEFLGKNIIQDSVNGAYIFNGPDNLGKTTAANYFAQSLLCANRGQARELPCGECPSCRSFSIKAGENMEIGGAHSDFHIIKKAPDKKNITIEQIREFIRILSLSSFGNGYKIGIIKHADSLSEEAANALLKTLEEPRKDVLVVLITENKDVLPATIISRCQILNFNLVKTDLIYDHLMEKQGASRSEALNYSRLALGRPALAVKFLQDQDFLEEYRKKADMFLNFLNQDMAGRLAQVDELMGKKNQGQEAANFAGRVLEIWQGVIRDFMLLEYNHNNLVHYPQVEERKASRLKITDWMRLSRLCRLSEEYLAANVNPKLVLENVAINL